MQAMPTTRVARIRNFVLLAIALARAPLSVATLMSAIKKRHPRADNRAVFLIVGAFLQASGGPADQHHRTQLLSAYQVWYQQQKKPATKSKIEEDGVKVGRAAAQALEATSGIVAVALSQMSGDLLNSPIPATASGTLVNDLRSQLEQHWRALVGGDPQALLALGKHGQKKRQATSNSAPEQLRCSRCREFRKKSMFDKSQKRADPMLRVCRICTEYCYHCQRNKMITGTHPVHIHIPASWLNRPKNSYWHMRLVPIQAPRSVGATGKHFSAFGGEYEYRI